MDSKNRKKEKEKKKSGQHNGGLRAEASKQLINFQKIDDMASN